MAELALSSRTPEPASAIIAGDGWQRPLPGLTTRSASPSIAELVEVIGEDATYQLCDTFGGISREIGAPAKAIVEAIGAPAANKLKAYWGRGRIYIPRRALSVKARHELIRELAKQGLTRTAIAMRVQISERQVYNVLGRAAAAAVLVLPVLRFANAFAEVGVLA